MSDPGSGKYRFNNATPSSVSHISLHYTDQTGGTPLYAHLISILFNTSTVKGAMRFITASGNYAVYTITAVTDNSTWADLTVSYITNSGFTLPSAGANAFVGMEAVGDKGSTGATGAQGPQGAAGAGSGDVVGPASSTTNRLVQFSNTTGKLIKEATGTGVVVAASGVPNFLTNPSGADKVLIWDDSASAPGWANIDTTWLATNATPNIGGATAPAISDFSNAIHLHTQNNNGGQLSIGNAINWGKGQNYRIVEEFLGLDTTSGSIGVNNWAQGDTGAGGSSFAAQTAGALQNHPGTMRLTTGTTNNGGRQLYLNNSTGFTLGSVQKQEWIFRVSAVTSCLIRVGIGTGASDGVYIEFDTSLSHTNFMYCKNVSSTATRTSMGLAPVANVWYYATITRTGSGAYDLYIERLDTAATGTGSVTGVSETVATQFLIQILSRSASASKTMDVDFFAATINMATRS
jgi:hypothetical protein